MNAKSISRTFLRLAAGIIVVCLSFAALGRALGGGKGAKVSVYRGGGLGEAGALIGQREISATDGYTAGVPDEAHFGLGANTTVDVRVVLPPDSRGLATNAVIDLTNVLTDRHLRLPNGCGGPQNPPRR
jgi:hypothetical protein